MTEVVQKHLDNDTFQYVTSYSISFATLQSSNSPVQFGVGALVSVQCVEIEKSTSFRKKWGCFQDA